MGSSGARTQAGIATTSGWNGCYFLCKETPDCVYFEWVNEQNSSMLLYLTKLGLHATYFKNNSIIIQTKRITTNVFWEQQVLLVLFLMEILSTLLLLLG